MEETKTVIKTAEEIAEALANWSLKYPRSRIYGMSQQKMDDELIQIEEDAKEYLKTKTLTMTPEAIEKRALEEFPIKMNTEEEIIFDWNEDERNAYIKGLTEGLSEKEKYAELKVEEYKKRIIQMIGKEYAFIGRQEGAALPLIMQQIEEIELITPNDK